MAVPIPALAQLGHIGLNVRNLDQSRDFYRRVLGLEVLREAGGGSQQFAFLGERDRLIVTLWQQAAQRFDASRSGLHHLSFPVANLQELEAFHTRLQELQVPILLGGIVAHMEGAPSCAVFFEDPDGNRLEVFSPTGAEQFETATDQGPSCGFF